MIEQVKENINRNRYRMGGMAAVGFGLLWLTGCGEPSPEIIEGLPATVVEHEYSAPYTTLIMAGKVMVPVYHPAQYDLEVQQCDRMADDRSDGNRDGCIQETVSVSSETYDQYKDGQEIILPAEDS